MSPISPLFGLARLHDFQTARDGMSRAVSQAVHNALTPYAGPLQDLYARNLKITNAGSLNVGSDMLTRVVQDSASKAVAEVTRGAFERALQAQV